MSRLTVVTFLWRQPGYHTQFEPRHVSALRDMVARNYPDPHRFVCLTDEDVPGVECLPLGDLHAAVPNPSRAGGPSCYRRLRLWSRSIRDMLGERIVSLDLDTVVVRDLRPLWNRPEDVVLWRDPLFLDDIHYNGSMILMTAGARPDVWDQFDPVESPKLTRAAGMFGSDQAWISYKLGSGMPTWGRRDGVYSFRLMDDRRLRKRTYIDMPERTTLPDNARIVFFHGKSNPWDDDVLERYAWVRKCYPGV